MLLEEPEHPPTMRELMTHTAGFGYGRGAEPAERLYRDEQGRDLFACGSLQALVARLAKAPLLDQPSRRWIYSLSMDLQGYIIERLSGRTLPEFMQARLFAPLGMNDTAFYVPTDKRNRFAELYRADRDGALIPMPVAPLELTYEQTPSLPQGGAGLVSTTGDYFRFAQMLLNGGTLDGVRLLAPSTTKLMMSNHLSDRLMADYSRPLANCPRLGLGYGYNGFVVTDPGRADVPLGAGSYGWDGAFGTWFWVDPSADLVFIGMVQRGELPGESPVGPPTDLQELARAVTYQALIHPER
jgi:CubicO group peptidase (beta-lactamase class C family)